MRVEIFDVEHGFCALVTGVSGEQILIDCGHNSTTGWRPSNHPLKQPLDLLIITNYDQDHLSDFCGIQYKIGFQRLCRNFSISPASLSLLKRQQDPLSVAMKSFIHTISQMGPPSVTPPLPSIHWTAFSIDFPLYPAGETNKYSSVVFLEADGINIVFPGDLSRGGWIELLSRPLFCEYLKRVNVFVAPHHGREDGFCEEVFKYRFCSPDVIVISDGPIQFDTQRSVDYSQYAKGIMVGGNTYYTLTTRRFGKLTIESTGYGFTVNASKGMSKPVSPILSALLSYSQAQRTPSASSLLDFGPTYPILRSLVPPPRTPSPLDLVPPRQGSILADLLKPPTQPLKPPASLLNPRPEDSPLASLLTELLRKRKKS